MSKLAPPNPRVPWFDPKTGEVSRYWLTWIEDLFTRVGGQTASTNIDLGIDMPEDVGVEEIRAQLGRLADDLSLSPVYAPEPKEADLAPPRTETPYEQFLETQVRELAEQIAQLRAEIDGIKQGLSL